MWCTQPDTEEDLKISSVECIIIVYKFPVRSKRSWTGLLCTLFANWHSPATLTEVFPCFFLSCKANARVYLPKTGHGPHSFTLVNCVVLCTVCVDCIALCIVCVDCVVLCIVCVECVVLRIVSIVLFCVLFVSNVLFYVLFVSIVLLCVLFVSNVLFCVRFVSIVLFYVRFVSIVLFYVLFVSIVLFYVLFVCKCVLYYCHRMSTQLQLTNIS
jgi:hypothetical protein